MCDRCGNPDNPWDPGPSWADEPPPWGPAPSRTVDDATQAHHGNTAGGTRSPRANIHSRESTGYEESHKIYDEQEDRCRSYCEDQGLEPVKVYREPNVSATQKTVEQRPDIQQSLNDVRAGVADAIVVPSMDRLFRNADEFDAFRQEMEQAGGFLVSARERIDTRRTGEWEAARNYVWVAEREAGNIGARGAERRAVETPEAYATQGRRPFGLTPDRTGWDPTLAAEIRQAAGRIAGGTASWADITREWAAKGIRGVSGGPIDVTSLRRILTSDRMLGLVPRHGEVLGKAPWPPLLDQDTVAKLKERAGPERARRADRSVEPVLIGGLLKCPCGHDMVGYTSGRNGTEQVNYKCSAATRGLESGQHASIRSNRIEEAVTDQAAAQLGRAGAVAGIVKAIEDHGPIPASAAKVIADHDQALGRLDQLASDRKISPEQHAELKGQAVQRQQAATKALDGHFATLAGGVDPRTLPQNNVAQLRVHIRRLPVRQRRAVIRLAFSFLTLDFARGRGRRFDASRRLIGQVRNFRNQPVDLEAWGRAGQITAETAASPEAEVEAAAAQPEQEISHDDQAAEVEAAPQGLFDQEANQQATVDKNWFQELGSDEQAWEVEAMQAKLDGLGMGGMFTDDQVRDMLELSDEPAPPGQLEGHEQDVETVVREAVAIARLDPQGELEAPVLAGPDDQDLDHQDRADAEAEVGHAAGVFDQEQTGPGWGGSGRSEADWAAEYQAAIGQDVADQRAEGVQERLSDEVEQPAVADFNRQVQDALAEAAVSEETVAFELGGDSGHEHDVPQHEHSRERD